MSALFALLQTIDNHFAHLLKFWYIMQCALMLKSNWSSTIANALRPNYTHVASMRGIFICIMYPQNTS